MNAWYNENKYKIDMIFNIVKTFIRTHNIVLTIDTRDLYTKFIHVCFRGSHKPFSNYNYSYYNIYNKHFNIEYETFIGSLFFDTMCDLKISLEEYDNLFLARLHPHSLQNFFENYFNIRQQGMSSHNKEDVREDTHEDNYIEY
tara:strand:+ start:120 stop:548 length:429 start_codon:yes stop_codon:yes gene_type:complete